MSHPGLFSCENNPPFTCVFDGGEEKNWKFFSSPPSKTQVVISLGWGGELFDERFKSSG